MLRFFKYAVVVEGLLAASLILTGGVLNSTVLMVIGGVLAADASLVLLVNVALGRRWSAL